MTREQMELLLNYVDAKLDLLEANIRMRADAPVSGSFMKERSGTARDSRQRLLASLEPAQGPVEPAQGPVEPSGQQGLWTMLLPHEWDKTEEQELKAFILRPEVKYVHSHDVSPLTGAIKVFYFGAEIPGAKPWHP
jgi:hypothetical protein